jgi:hypothetical protein
MGLNIEQEIKMIEMCPKTILFFAEANVFAVLSDQPAGFQMLNTRVLVLYEVHKLAVLV